MDKNVEKLDIWICDKYTRDYHGDDIVEIAKIVDTNSLSDVLYIFYDRETYAKTHYHITAGLYGEDVPAVMVDDEHKDLLYDRPEIFFALMLHELGHYRNNDIEALRERLPDTQKILRDRRLSISAGFVQEHELKADAFAEKHIGKNKMIQAIDYMIKKRKKRIDDPIKEIAIKEFELRKKAITRL